MPNTPKENQKLCEMCDGIGWLRNDKKGMIEKCPECFNGIIHVCPICQSKMNGLCMSESCQDLREFHKEQKRLEKAIIGDFSEVPPESMEMLYSERYGYQEGFFSEMDELLEYCEENDVDVPEYVWSTTKRGISISADDILEQACEELHEDARDRLVGEDELQKFLDEWCKKQAGAESYEVDYKYAIRVPKEFGGDA